jgi:hypothetical protein
MKRALTIAVLLTLATPIAGTNQASAKKGVKTPVVKKKLKRAIPTKTATTLPSSPTSTVPAGVVDPQSQEAVLAAYQRFEDVRYAVYVDKTKATIELPKVATELTLAAELRVAKSMAGTTWTAKREEWRSLDTRIIEFNPPTAVVRACITGSMAPVLVLATGLQIPDQVSFSSDSAVNMHYVKGKGWLVTSIDWFDDSFGDSKCAVGR